jgi:ElaB/YqjD/DUF883 family membrane-anchored ribosome-binding protein
MPEKISADSDVAALLEDVQSLKRDFSVLVSRLRDNAVSSADSVYQNVADQGQRTAKALSDRVEEQPLMSLFIAFGIGFLSGRFLSR